MYELIQIDSKYTIKWSRFLRSDRYLASDRFYGEFWMQGYDPNWCGQLCKPHLEKIFKQLSEGFEEIVIKSSK